MLETVKTLFSEEMHEENDFCVLSGNFERSLHIDDDDFVWISRQDPVYCSLSVVKSHNVQDYEEFSLSIDTQQRNKAHSISASTIMSDFEDDFSYDQHVKQFDSVTRKVSHKKCYNQQRLRQRQATFLKVISSEYDNDSNDSILNTFDRPTTDILKSIVSENNYYRGLFGDVIKKGLKSVVAYAWIYTKRYPIWEPGARPDLIYAFINNKFNKRYRSWRLAVKAVKVYKLTEDRIKNEIIFQKVQKEKEHLILLRKAKTNVPEVMRCSCNVIVTSIIGTEDKIAPPITNIPLKRCSEMYGSIVKEMTMWYKTLHLVHGKLSCRNILYWKDQLYYIGWSHSLRREHPWALKKLMRDCHFITKFFERRHVRVKSTERLFQDITGLNKIDRSVLRVIHSADLWKKWQSTNPNRIGLETCNLGRNCRFKRMPKSVIISSSLEESEEENNLDTRSGDFLLSLHMDDQLPVEEKVTRNKKLSQQRVRQRRATLATVVGSSEHRNSEPDFNAFDKQTNEILKRIYSRNHFYIGRSGYVVGKGENSTVLSASISIKSKNKYTGTPKWDSTAYAVKVYKLGEDKIKNEKMFQHVQNEKEHLISLYEAKSNVPEVRQGSQNVLVMSLIGMGQETLLANVPLRLCQEMYCTIIKEMKMWYNTLNLVLGKLSMKNILNWNNKLYYIGWGHSVSKDHPQALKKLMRDCHFVTKFFESRLVPVKSTEDLFEDITGHRNINNTEDLWKSLHLTNPNRIGYSASHGSGGHCRFK